MKSGLSRTVEDGVYAILVTNRRTSTSGVSFSVAEASKLCAVPAKHCVKILSIADGSDDLKEKRTAKPQGAILRITNGVAWLILTGFAACNLYTHFCH